MSLELIASLVIAHGYPLLFTIIALDCAFLPIPGELLLLTFGGIAVQAQFDLGIGIAVAALAVLVGDSISYWLGRFGGKRVMNKFRFAQRWTLGAPAVVFGRFVIGARVVVAPLAGARRMPFGRFLLFDAIGATLWAGSRQPGGRAAALDQRGEHDPVHAGHGGRDLPRGQAHEAAATAHRDRGRADRLRLAPAGDGVVTGCPIRGDPHHPRSAARDPGRPLARVLSLELTPSPPPDPGSSAHSDSYS
ncbi:MAG: hypothetical protein DME05_21335 [Candidatus Rokuibacteriota bacterium]|nr:MAG: hypothetical protein DME05_21335 [Candidatus Rokubacteria bacterium]